MIVSNKKISREHPYGEFHALPVLLTVVLAAVVCFSGCSRGPGIHRGNTYKIEYNVARPELVTIAGREKIPKDLIGVRTRSVTICEGKAIFGMYNYGLAIFDIETEKWTRIPIDFRYTRELLVIDATCDGDTIYTGLSGMGVGIHNLRTGETHVYENPHSEQSNSIVNVIKTGESLLVATHDGLFSFDLSEKTFSLVEDEKYILMLLVNGHVLTLSDFSDKYYFKTFDLSGNKTHEEEITALHPTPSTFVYANGSLVAATQNKLYYLDNGIENPETVKAPGSFPGFVPTNLDSYDGGMLLCNYSGLVHYNETTREWTQLGVEAGIPKGVLDQSVYGTRIFLAMETGPFIIDSEIWKEMMFLAGRGRKPAVAGTTEGEVIATSDRDTWSWKHITTRDGLPHDSVMAVLPTGDSVWLGTYLSGLTELSMNDFSIKTYLYDIGGEKSSTAFPVTELQAYVHTIWHAGYSYYGRFDTRTRKWAKPPQKISEDPSHNAEALYLDDGYAYMGVRKEGFRIINMGTEDWQSIEGNYLEFSPFITDIVRVGSTMLLSMDSGLSRYNIKSGSIKRMDIGVFDIESMVTDRSNLWLGSRERSLTAAANNTGLFKYNLMTRHLTSFNTIPGVRGTHVNKVVVDGPFVWVASEQGLERFCRLSGNWTYYSAVEGLLANNIYSIAVYGNRLFAGTDNGLFIKTITQFDSENENQNFEAGWLAENAGNHRVAASIYRKLASSVPKSESDYLQYRAAWNLEMAGETASALQIYEQLRADFPLLLVDIESVFSSAYGMDVYVEKLMELYGNYTQGSNEKALCHAHLKYMDNALKLRALTMERNGDTKSALRLWKLALSISTNKSIDKEARKKIRELGENIPIN